ALDGRGLVPAAGVAPPRPGAQAVERSGGMHGRFRRSGRPRPGRDRPAEPRVRLSAALRPRRRVHRSDGLARRVIQEEGMEQLPRMRVSRADMMKRVARFNALKGSDGGLPDSRMPGCERTLYNVIGFQPPPKDDSGMINSPVGEEAARLAAIQIREGFNLG